MIKVTFYHSSSELSGFKIKGHSGYATQGSDIVCAAVSSAAYMTANTVIEIMKLDAFAEIDENGGMTLKLNEADAHKAKDILLGFELHLKELTKQYPKNVTITTEV